MTHCVTWCSVIQVTLHFVILCLYNKHICDCIYVYAQEAPCDISLELFLQWSLFRIQFIISTQKYNNIRRYQLLVALRIWPYRVNPIYGINYIKSTLQSHHYVGKVPSRLWYNYSGLVLGWIHYISDQSAIRNHTNNAQRLSIMLTHNLNLCDSHPSIFPTHKWGESRHLDFTN
jgi:hypothetical protein